MRAIVQRTDSATVEVNQETVARIGPGLTVLLGVGREDSEQDARYLVEKIINLRIFPDEHGKMNLSLIDTGGDLLVVSQFTLFGDCRKGRRPSFDGAASPEKAIKLYENFIDLCRESGINTTCGRFQAEMIISLANHGPVTMILDSNRIF
jgi:D-aminoacyl-tRNA deacylase